MDRYKNFEIEVLLRNSSPMADFENLSPSNFHYILYDTYNENAPVHFRKNIENEVLDKVSLFRIAEDLISNIEREKAIKLTPLGALPKKVMLELYEKKYICDELIERGMIKLWREQDCIAIMSTKIVMEIAGVTKKTNGKLTLTKKGISFFKPENRQEFFKLFITTFADKFNWGFNDGYPDKPIGQFGWTFTIYLLGKYGMEYQPAIFYADKYLRALPRFLNEFESTTYSTDREEFARCFRVRSFERFLDWFGLVEIERNGKTFLDNEVKIKCTEILTKIFNIDI